MRSLECEDRAVCSKSVTPTLSAQEIDALLRVLERGLVLVRLAAGAGDAARAEAIADALHNVPRLLREGEKWRWTTGGFRRLFLEPLVARYPDLAELEEPLGDVGRGA